MAQAGFEDWVGRRRTEFDVVTAAALGRLAAVLDGAMSTRASGAPHPLSCWLFFLPTDRQGDLAPDGHPHRGTFLPPVELPSRMWAGSELRFHAPLEVGEQINRTSTIESVTNKRGRSGDLTFVSVAHSVSAGDRLLVTERQDIVYRGAPTAGAASTAPSFRDPKPKADWRARVDADSALLMRYSALTFNAHKIHYDREYTTDVEGYPGLVVHGPLIATLLLELFLTHHPGAVVETFGFRAVRPAFEGAPLHLEAIETSTGADLSAVGPSGEVCMTAAVGAR